MPTATKTTPAKRAASTTAAQRTAAPKGERRAGMKAKGGNGGGAKK